MKDKIEIEVSIGELLDKISILEIKQERIKDPAKLFNIQEELLSLMRYKEDYMLRAGKEAQIYSELKSTNEALWQIEDEIRLLESEKNFGPEFIKLARLVYFENDKRAKLKKDLNTLLGSRLVEEKSYADY